MVTLKQIGSESSGALHDKAELVEVIWNDAWSENKWADPDNLIVEDMRCRTIGFLVDESDDRIVVTTTYAACGVVIDPLTIPKGCVLSVHRIAFAK